MSLKLKNPPSNTETEEFKDSYISELIEFGSKYFGESFAQRYEEITNNLFPEIEYKITLTGIETGYYKAGLDIKGRMRMIRKLATEPGGTEKLKKIATTTKFLKSEESIKNKLDRKGDPKKIYDYTRGTLIRLGEPYSSYNEIYDDIFKIEEMFSDQFYLLPLDDDNRKSGVKAKLKAGGYSDITLRFARHGTTEAVLEWQINSAACEEAKKLEDENYSKKKILVIKLIQLYESKKSELVGIPEFDTTYFMDCLNAKCRFDVRCQFKTPNSFGISEQVYDTFIEMINRLGLLDENKALSTNNTIINEFVKLFKNGYSIYEEANPIINNVQSGIKFIEGFKIAQTEHKKFKDNPKANS
jgi:hypothetical protein